MMNEETQKIEYSVLESSAGPLTLHARKGNQSFLIHSIVDPMEQARRFCDCNGASSGDIFVYGLGLGYHIIEMTARLKPSQNMYIMECSPETAEAALQIDGVREALQRRNTYFLFSDDEDEVMRFVRGLPPATKMLYYEPSVKCLPERLERVRAWLIDLKMAFNVSEDQRQMPQNHLRNSGKFPEFFMSYTDELSGSDCILRASGPSLTDHLEFAEEVSHTQLLCSVGRNTEVFERHGIEPDIWFESDSSPVLAKRFKDSQSKALFLFVSTVHPETADSYDGPKAYIHIGVNERVKQKYQVQGGGSTVVTTALEALIAMGVKRVFLIGQDLCYRNDMSHMDRKTVIRASAPKVECFDGAYRYTTEAFLKHKRSIEALLKTYGGRLEVYSLSRQGAKIEGVKFLSIDACRTMLGSDCGVKLQTERLARIFSSSPNGQVMD